MLRVVLVLAAMSLLGGTCCGDWEDADVEIAPIDDVKVALFHCQRDPLTGELVNPACEPSPPISFELPVQVVHAESGRALCGVEVNAEVGEGRVVPEVLEGRQISDEEGWVTFEVEVALGDYWSMSEGAVLVTAGEDGIYVVIQQWP